MVDNEVYFHGNFKFLSCLEEGCGRFLEDFGEADCRGNEVLPLGSNLRLY